MRATKLLSVVIALFFLCGCAQESAIAFKSVTPKSDQVLRVGQRQHFVISAQYLAPDDGSTIHLYLQDANNRKITPIQSFTPKAISGTVIFKIDAVVPDTQYLGLSVAFFKKGQLETHLTDYREYDVVRADGSTREAPSTN